jgi:hypothetical protein
MVRLEMFLSETAGMARNKGHLLAMEGDGTSSHLRPSLIETRKPLFVGSPLRARLCLQVSVVLRCACLPIAGSELRRLPPNGVKWTESRRGHGSCSRVRHCFFCHAAALRPPLHLLCACSLVVQRPAVSAGAGQGWNRGRVSKHGCFPRVRCPPRNARQSGHNSLDIVRFVHSSIHSGRKRP